MPLGSVRADTVLEQRIYHLTHIRNLAGMVSERAILAGARGVVELSPEELRAERTAVIVPGGSARPLGDYVPFFLSPDADLWQSLRAGIPHPRLSLDARQAETTDFVFVVSNVRQVVAAGGDYVNADDNAEDVTTRFATTREDADRMLFRLRNDADAWSPRNAELLVADRFPLESVTLIGVGNDKVRAAVREILNGSDFTPKLSVYPPWFQPTDD